MSTSVDLTPEELALVAQVNFDPLAVRGAEHERRGQAVAELMKSLITRKAIPEQRVRYFIDPDYFAGGRGKSRKQLFESNGTRGEAIFHHAHFLEYLHYFLYGASLSPNVITAFENEVARCGGVSSSDIVPLGRFARQLARSNYPDPAEQAEEFYKLALDCGLYVSYAQSVRSAVKQAKPSRR